MGIIFKCKTNAAYIIKILSELLANNIKRACFEIDKNGISLSMHDGGRTVLLDLKLYSKNFIIYKFKKKKKQFLGINLNHFYKMLKSIKKKDTIQLYIDNKCPNELAIKVIPKDNNRVTISFIKIQVIQNLLIDIPTGYTSPIIIPSSEWYKMIKDMHQIGSKIVVTSYKFKIQFECDNGSVMKRRVEFGETDDSDSDDSDSDGKDDEKNKYKQIFDTEQFSRITKIAGLNQSLKIYPKNNLPLLFESQVGTLGIIKIYIKSKEQIEKDQNNLNNIINNDEDFKE